MRPPSAICMARLVGLALAIPALTAAAADGQQRSFRAGACAVDISPDVLPVVVNAMFTERSADKVVDPLFARALVLDDGETRIALCVVDTCVMPRALIDSAKAIAGPAARIPIERICISATHTHSAPSVMACLGSGVDERYAAALPGRIAEAIAGAARNLGPAGIGWAAVDDWRHTFNRRWIRRPDRMLTDPFGAQNVRAHMHPGHESPDVVGPSGPVDPELCVLAARSLEGRPLALFANYSQHYYGAPLLSSDYCGRFAAHIAALLGADTGAPAFVGMISQGTSGDLMWMDYGAPRQEIGYDAYARELAEQALAAYGRIEWHDWVPLRAAARTLALRARVPDAARLDWARVTVAALGGGPPRELPEIYAREALYLSERPETTLELQALRIGELGIAAIPAEVFAITGLKLKAQSPLPRAFVIELANGCEGYVPPPEQHALGGYTTWPARTAGLEVQAEPRIVETVLGLLEEVAERPRRELALEHGPYAQAVLAAGPAAYWRLDDIVIPTARDAGGACHDAAYERGVALYLPGAGSGSGHLPEPRLEPSPFSGTQINRAAHFAGGRVRARLPKLGRDYTVELWLWNGLPADARAVTGYVLSLGVDGDAAAGGDHLGIGGTYKGGETGRLLVFNGNERGEVLVGARRLGLRQWHHVALVREGTSVAVYLDGAPEIGGALESTVPVDGAELFVGGRCDGFANFEGRLDEVAVYDRALTAAEIAQHFRAGQG